MLDFGNHFSQYWMVYAAAAGGVVIGAGVTAMIYNREKETFCHDSWIKIETDLAKFCQVAPNLAPLESLYKSLLFSRVQINGKAAKAITLMGRIIVNGENKIRYGEIHKELSENLEKDIAELTALCKEQIEETKSWNQKRKDKK